MNRSAVIAALLAVALTGSVRHGAAAEPPSAARELRFSIERYLNMRSAMSPDIAPDMKSIIFRTNISGTHQVWRMDARGGWPDQITAFEDVVSSAEFSPTDGRIAFLKSIGGSEQDQIFLLSADGADITPVVNEPGVTHYWGGWSKDGRSIAYSGNSRDPKFFDPYIMDLETGKSERVIGAEASYNAAGFSPKGRYLLLVKYTSNFDQDLYVFERATKALTHLTPHTGDVRYQSPVWTPDEKSLYIVTDLNRDFLNLARIDLADRKLTFLEERKWDTEAVRLSDDGRIMAVQSNVDGLSELRLYEGGPGGKPLPAPKLAPGLLSNLNFSRDASFFVFSYITPTAPVDVFRWDLVEQKLTQLTWSSTMGIPRSTFVAPELVHYRSFDGLEIPAYLYLPQGTAPGERAPCLVMMHGGPESQERPDFTPVWQYYLQAGYAIFAPNVRGSTGYGKAYSHLDDVRKREDSVKDMAAGVEFLKASNRVDPDRVAVMGGSYGGYMTLAGLTKYPDLFAAGVNTVGIANFITFLEKTSAYRRQWRIVEYGDPTADRDFLTEVSPINHVDKIKAPLMIIQGANDPRVPQHEADQMAAAIKARGGVVDYLLYPDEGHGLSKLKNRIDAYPKIIEFLDRNVKNRLVTKVRG